MKVLRKQLGFLFKLMLLVALGYGGWVGYQWYSAAEQDGSDIGTLETATAMVRDITVSVSATGVLQPIRIVEVKSKASGEILEMPVELGDFLRAGDLIAQIDTEILDQELKQAQADFESAKVRLEIAERQFERARQLHVEDLISANDLEQSQQNFTSAESTHLRAEAALELARERLEDATVRAPITGTVISKTVETGQIIQSSTSNVSGGTTLVQMADLSELEIRTLVDEVDIGKVRAGLPVRSTVEAYPTVEFEGEVIKIEPSAVVQQSVTTFPVLSRIDNSDGLLLPGMNADVEVIVHQRPGVLAIPNPSVRSLEDARQVMDLLGLETTPTVHQASAGLLYDEEGWLAAADTSAAVAFVVDAEGMIVPREIGVGVADWEYTEVVGGLVPGESVAILPSTSLLRSQQELRERLSQRSGIPGVTGGSRGRS